MEYNGKCFFRFKYRNKKIINNVSICKEKYNQSIIDKVDDLVMLEKGFYFNLVTRKLFNNNIEIYLTKIESQLFELLISNLNRTTKIEDISEHVWRKRNFSKNSLRNYIKKIRDKTYYDIIINKYKEGYKIVSND